MSTSDSFVGTDGTGAEREPAVPPEDGALRLVLVRHGRTPSNVHRALDTLPPGPSLDELGREQAGQVAELLAGWPVRAVYASTAARAGQTAEPIAARHGLPVTVLGGVHEVFVGELENRSDAESRRRFDETFTAWWDGDPDVPQPGGESATDLLDRFLPDVDTAVAGVESGAVVLVSHGAAIRLASAALLAGRAEQGLGRDSPLPNTGRVVLRRDPDGWALELWDPMAGPPDY